jgi:lysozyme
MRKAKNYIITLAIVGLLLISRKLSATKIISEFEGLRLRAYQDTGNIWTIGFGTTINPETGLPIKKGDIITKEKALAWLRINVAGLETQIKKLVKVPLNPNQLTALTSLAYNIGIGAFSRSTLLRLLNAGTDKNTVAAQFIRWNKVKGKEVPGLTRRRKLEAELFLS